MKKFYLLVVLGAVLLLSACSKDTTEPIEQPQVDPVQTTGTITTSGSVEGLSYSLDRVAVNPDAIILTNKNAALSSSADELKNGKLCFSNIAADISEGKVLYVNIDGYRALRKIDKIILPGNIWQARSAVTSTMK